MYWKRRWSLPTGARVLMGAASLLLLLVSVTSVPQAVQDTLINVPLLRQPTPWAVVVALAIVLFYVAVRSGYSVPSLDEIRVPVSSPADRPLDDRGAVQFVLPNRQGDTVPFERYQALQDKLEATKADLEERWTTEREKRLRLVVDSYRINAQVERLQSYVADLEDTVKGYRERESREE